MKTPGGQQKELQQPTLNKSLKGFTHCDKPWKDQGLPGIWSRNINSGEHEEEDQIHLHGESIAQSLVLPFKCKRNKLTVVCERKSKNKFLTW